MARPRQNRRGATWRGIALAVVTGAAACATSENAPSPAAEIVGGRADTGRDPGVVALALGDEGLCSATLIAPRAVLTARHCVSRLVSDAVDCAAPGPQTAGERDAASLVVLAGDDARHGTPLARGVRVLVPPGDRLCEADLAVVVLDRAVTAAPVVPVELARAPRPGDHVTAVGYGRTRDASGAGQKRRRDDVPIVAVARREFEVARATCSGDSGGPALAATTGAVVGVVSRGGPACAARATRNVYTRVDAWADLVREGLRLGGAAVAAGAADGGTPTAGDGGTPAGACRSEADCPDGYCIRSSHRCAPLCPTGRECLAGFHCATGSGGVRACFPDR